MDYDRTSLKENELTESKRRLRGRTLPLPSEFARYRKPNKEELTKKFREKRPSMVEEPKSDGSFNKSEKNQIKSSPIKSSAENNNTLKRKTLSKQKEDSPKEEKKTKKKVIQRRR